MRWEDLREEEFAPAIKESHGVCAMAMGCLEMHGQHLPLGTDTLKGGRILDWAAEREPVMTLPPLQFGSLEGARKSDPAKGETHYGYFALSTSLLMDLLEEICDEVERNGFDKFVICNSHGGNLPLLNCFMRRIVSKKRKCKVFMKHISLPNPADILAEITQKGLEAYPALKESDLDVLREYVDNKRTGGHACLSESALIYGTYPELVRMDKADDLSGVPTGRTGILGQAGIIWGDAWALEYPNAYSGYSSTALTKELSDVFVEAAVANLAKALGVLKNDELMSSLD